MPNNIDKSFLIFTAAPIGYMYHGINIIAKKSLPIDTFQLLQSLYCNIAQSYSVYIKK